MSTRFDCLSPRPGKDGKTFWHRVGTAFTGRDGGMQVYLDSYPLPGADGKVSFIIREARDLREASGTVSRQQRQAPAAQRETDYGDSIPF